MALYKDGNPVSGLNSIPRLTSAQYNALNIKPEFWVWTDAPESYKKLSADQVSYDSNNTVKDKIDWHYLGALNTSNSISVSGYSEVCYCPMVNGTIPYNAYHFPYISSGNIFLSVYQSASYNWTGTVVNTNGTLTLTQGSLSGWNSVTIGVYAK